MKQEVVNVIQLLAENAREIQDLHVSNNVTFGVFILLAFVLAAIYDSKPKGVKR